MLRRRIAEGADRSQPQMLAESRNSQCSGEQVRERLIERGKLELEARALELFRHRALPAEERFGEFAHREAQSRRWNRSPGWPVQRASQALGELLHVDDARRGQVDRTLQAVVIKTEEDGRDLVLQVNPGQPLLAAADGSADESLEGRD